MEPNLNEVRQELADLHDQLLSLPADDYGKRSELKDRQHEVRQLSYRMIEGKPLHDRALLNAAYQRLQDVRDRMLDQHLSSTSGGDAGIDSVFTQAVNKAIDSGLGVDEVEARLERILDQMCSSR